MFLLPILLIALLYAIYYSAARKTNFVHSFRKSSKTNEEFFKLEDKHLSYFRNVAVDLFEAESGAPYIRPQLIDFLNPGGLSLRNGLKTTSKRKKREYVLEILLQNAQLVPGNYKFENRLIGKGYSKHLDPLYSHHTVTFEITNQHVKLLRKLWVGWEDYLYALAVHVKRPFGDATFFELDMADILGIDISVAKNGDISTSDREKLNNLYELYLELVPAMQVLLNFGEVQTGWYQRLGEFKPWQLVTDPALLQSLSNE